MKRNRITLTVLLCLLLCNYSFSQCPGFNNMQALDSLFTNPFFGNTTTPEADKLHRPYTYLANVAGGIKIYDNNAGGVPFQVGAIPVTALGGLDVINLYQDSIWLYACLGNIWDTTQMAGLAIIDVSSPTAPVVLDYYVHPGITGGAGAVAIRGNFAYLAANQNGLLILDISNKSNIQLISTLPFSHSFPHSTPGSASLYNARGIALSGNNAYICFDRGGLRVADISNASAPVQISQYCFSALIDKATAYNNIVIHQNIAYVSIDYYGLEVLDITNPTSISQLGWWHPSSWADTTNNYSVWSASNGHANELAYDSLCNKVYIAAGKSDLVAVDVANPSMPVTCQTYGTPADSYGTWGLDFFDGKIYIAYIWSTVAPPYSNYTGYKILQTDCIPAGIDETTDQPEVIIAPNPATENIHVYISGKDAGLVSIRIYDLQEKLLETFSTPDISLSSLPPGMYIILVETRKSVHLHKLLRQ